VLPSVRRAFRARLDREPRRWVLLLSALGAPAFFAVALQERRAFWYGQGVGVAVVLVVAATLPAAGALLMLAHGRLLWWAGRALGGQATPAELHAAHGWAQLPLIVAAAPFVLEIPLRAAAAESDPVPGWLLAVLGWLDRAAPVLEPVALAAAVAGALLYPKLLAEAQRFSSWRALASQTLAGAAGLALLLGAVAAAGALLPDADAGWQVALAATPLAAVLGIAADLALRALSARRRGASPPPDPSPDPPAAAEGG
jgi:hypothetical protein